MMSTKEDLTLIENKKTGIEILRIIAAAMICAGHINISLWYNCDNQNRIFPYVTLIEMFCLYGVNIFGLITGYLCVYSKLNTKRIIKVVFLVLFYSYLGLLIATIWKTELVNIDYLLQSIFPISKGVYWYVSAYITVMIISPLYNCFLQRIEKNGGVATIIVLLMVAGYCFFVNDVLSVGWGYNAIWLSWLYIMGGVLRIVKDKNYFRIWNFPLKSVVYISIYCLSVIMNWVILLHFHDNPYVNARVQRYNNVFIVIGAISIFLGVCDIQLKNTIIKKIVDFSSSCCLAVYLIQVNPLFWNQIISERYLYLLNSTTRQYLTHFIMHVVITFIVLSGIDKMRQLFFEISRINKLIDIVSHKLNQLLKV